MSIFIVYFAAMCGYGDYCCKPNCLWGILKPLQSNSNLIMQKRYGHRLSFSTEEAKARSHWFIWRHSSPGKKSPPNEDIAKSAIRVGELRVWKFWERVAGRCQSSLLQHWCNLWSYFWRRKANVDWVKSPTFDTRLTWSLSVVYLHYPKCF